MITWIDVCDMPICTVLVIKSKRDVTIMVTVVIDHIIAIPVTVITIHERLDSATITIVSTDGRRLAVAWIHASSDIHYQALCGELYSAVQFYPSVDPADFYQFN